MRILIVEDEPAVARYIAKMVGAILGRAVREIRICHTLDRALHALMARAIDLCLLDLNLSGEDGFELLRQAAAMPFQTIVLSAHAERAVEAFDYGVLDFVVKPFSRDRLRKALERYSDRERGGRRAVRYLAYRRGGECRVVAVDTVLFFKADRYLVEAHPVDGPAVLLEKSLTWLEGALPTSFLRIHRSYIVSQAAIESFRHTRGGVYKVRLKNGRELPLSRTYLKAVRTSLNP